MWVGWLHGAAGGMDMAVHFVLHTFEDGNTVYVENGGNVMITVESDDFIGVELTREEALAAAHAIIAYYEGK